MFADISLPPNAYAATNHNISSSKQLIEEILKGKDFGEEKTVRKWRFRNWVEENEDRIPDWLIEMVEWWEKNIDFSDTSESINTTAFWLKLLLVGFFIILLVYLFYKFRGPLRRRRERQKSPPAPETMFGLDVRAESLPEDVPDQVMQLWRDNQPREALSLLYRATLARLIQDHSLAFKSSYTEAECAALVQAYGIASLSQYFSQLTLHWRRLAYGHQLPAASALQQLCDTWPRVTAHDPH
jgi:hypothetical protein